MTLPTTKTWQYKLQVRVLLEKTWHPDVCSLLEKCAFYIHASVRLTTKERTLMVLCGLNARASPSDRLDGIIRNTNTRERDSILYGSHVF